VKETASAAADMENLVASARAQDVAATFSSAASPGVVSLFFGNEHYADDESYVMTIAEAMRLDYETIADAEAFVQVDCPDLAMGVRVGMQESTPTSPGPNSPPWPKAQPWPPKNCSADHSTARASDAHARLGRSRRHDM